MSSNDAPVPPKSIPPEPISPETGQSETVPSKASADELLDELESIKDLLEDIDLDDDLDIDIPILDDVVAQQDNDEASDPSDLLDLNSIFDDKDDDLLEGGLDLSDLDTDVAIPSFKLITADDDSGQPAPNPALDNGHNTPTDDGESTLPDSAATLSADNDRQTTAAEQCAPDPATSASTTANDNAAQANIDIDLLIQEVVDEFIPAIEDKLRQRLSACSPELLRQLAERHVKR